jgi:hypothetical protein
LRVRGLIPRVECDRFVIRQVIVLKNLVPKFSIVPSAIGINDGKRLHISPRRVDRLVVGECLHDQGNTLSIEIAHVARHVVVECSTFYHTESYNTGVNQPCKQALAEEPLKSVVSAPVVVWGTTKQLELEDKAIRPMAYDKVEAMDAVQTDRRPFLALAPTIRTTMELRLLN